MPISMSAFARYVTQTSLYTSPYTGRLTDRRIAHYQKLGYYNQDVIVERVEQRKKRAAKKRFNKAKAFAKFDL